MNTPLPARAADERRLPSLRRGAPLTLHFEGAPLAACEGESVAAALLAAGIRRFRATASGEPRGPYCGIGVCFDCLVVIDGLANVRACQTAVRADMKISRQLGWGEGPDGP